MFRELMVLPVLVAMFVGGQVALKSALQTLHVNGVGSVLATLPQILKSPLFWVWFLSYAVGTLIWMGMLSRLQVSVVYPMMVALSLVLTYLAGNVFFQEMITGQKLIAMALIILGTIVLSR